jgi:hypothetical protein
MNQVLHSIGFFLLLTAGTTSLCVLCLAVV